MIIKRLSIMLATTLAVLTVQAQKVQKNVDYVVKYQNLAIEQQRRHKIPASITLAQGILESQSGSSRLAVKANNHFGIKCNNWSGESIYHNDDEKGECFRKYPQVTDSYEDHSLFLTGRSRYAVLFTLNQSDYVGWAKGLQKCGYATDRSYANKLIKIIEDYELYKYDSMIVPTTNKDDSFPAWYQPHEVYKDHGLIYVVAKDGDSYELLSAELGFKISDLRKYNEVPSTFNLIPGEVVYLEKKNKKGTNQSARFHTVKVGESMHIISQLYGIRIEELYKMNNKGLSYIPSEGDLLKLR